MARLIFDDLLIKGVKSGQIPARTKEAREWYRNSAKGIKKVNESTLMKTDVDRLKNRVAAGSMYLFAYDPKYKKTLPYYDNLPLIFPFKKVEGGFLGINLHYLPLNLRAKLMDGLYEYTNNTRYDETTKINLSYGLLNKAAKLRYFKPCIKHYLTEHVRSRFMYIHPTEWDMALFLPLARFEGATQREVWEDSRRKIF